MTVPKLVRLLVAFHEMMLGKCLEHCLAYGKHLISSDFTDVGGIIAQATLPWVSSKEHGGYLLGVSYTAGGGGRF